MRVRSVLLAIGFVIALPLGAFAQASISGVVRDASGGVLPGVTVEASSPVLIEKTRSAVSDANGRYTIPICAPERTVCRSRSRGSRLSSARAWN
jgi:hypothetical protein